MNHPRPQLARERFIPLDGDWHFHVTEAGPEHSVLEKVMEKVHQAELHMAHQIQSSSSREEGPGAAPLTPGETIRVPYPPEAPLSGIGRVAGPEDWLHYRRSFRLPAGLYLTEIHPV